MMERSNKNNKNNDFMLYLDYVVCLMNNIQTRNNKCP